MCYVIQMIICYLDCAFIKCGVGDCRQNSAEMMPHRKLSVLVSCWHQAGFHQRLLNFYPLMIYLFYYFCLLFSFTLLHCFLSISCLLTYVGVEKTNWILVRLGISISKEKVKELQKLVNDSDKEKIYFSYLQESEDKRNQKIKTRYRK